MSVFRHPHLTRGVVKTAKGAFLVSRGLVDVPDEIGDSLGWLRLDVDIEMSSPTHEAAERSARRMTPAEAGHPASCPWCGQSRIRGVTGPPDGNHHYRCAACGTTFFIHALQHRHA